MSYEYIGFTLNGVHSSSFNIYRTSGGDRYSSNLLPTFNNDTVEINGKDGTEYFGSTYRSKSFSINFATDKMSETNLHELTILLSNKQMMPLIFDEYPWKTYQVKADGTPTFSFIPFLVNGERVYRGEGIISLVAYYPFATCSGTKKFLNDSSYSDTTYWSDKTQWSAASRLLSSRGAVDILSSGAISLYNAGDIETPFLLKLMPTTAIFNVYLYKNGTDIINQFQCNTARLKTTDSPTTYYIDMKKHLIYYYKTVDSIEYTVICNEIVSAGSWFNIPVSSTAASYSLLLSGISASTTDNTIEYSYIYY